MHSRVIRLWGAAFLLCAVVLAIGWGTLSAQANAEIFVQQATPPAANPADDGGGDHQGEDEIRSYGLIEVMPANGLTGTWVISGTSYTANEATEFEPEHGGFAAGVCVKVVVEQTAPTLALKIESESAYHCSSDDDDDDGGHHDGKLYGPIVSLPDNPDLLGPWVVGAETFTVTTDTKLAQEEMPFAVGVVVKVEFKEVDGQKFATSVESKFKLDDDDDDHGGHHGHHRGHDGRAFGPIEALPDNLIGTWIIAGLNYSVTETTELRGSGVYTVGENVKVEYYANSAGERIATEIKHTGYHGGVSGRGVFKFVGWVSAKPAGFIGLWTIGGEPFTATNTTRFDESDGLLTSTSYVEATYKIQDDQRVLLKLETAVPPGAGDDNNVGPIENLGSADAASEDSIAAELWRVGGVEYAVTAATQVIGADAELTVGRTVVVNSYVDAGGATTATRIQAITLENRVLLPLMQR